MLNNPVTMLKFPHPERNVVSAGSEIRFPSTGEPFFKIVMTPS
jgi:hypothetical protein